MKKKFQNYAVEDFLTEPKFRAWVLESDQEAQTFWHEWMREHPNKVAIVQEARFILLAMKDEFEKEQLNRFEKVAMRHQLELNVAEESSPSFYQIKPIKSRRRTLRFMLSLTGVLALLISAGLGFYFWQQNGNTVQYKTAFGETKTFYLPDSSLVTLNFNSTLRLSKNWEKGEVREVWLDGEAFFEVTKASKHKNKFVVHTHDLDVNVLGTQFNVKSRERATHVVLEEGSVQLELNSTDMQEIMMEPGDMVTYSAKNQEIKTKEVKAELYSSWKDNVLHFENQTLEEIADVLEAYFEVEITIRDSSLKDRLFNFYAPTTKINVALENLSTYCEVKESKDGKRIQIFEKQ